MRQILLGNRLPRVKDAEADISVLRRSTTDNDLLLRRRVVNGIADKVADNLLREKFIRPDIDRLLRLNLDMDPILFDQDG